MHGTRESFDNNNTKHNGGIFHSDHYLNAIFLAANDAILILDATYRVTAANAVAERLYGYSAAELTTKRLHDLRVPHTHTAIDGQMQRSLEEDGARWETHHLRKDGTCFPVEISSRPFHLGEALHFVHIVRDISEQQRTEQVLRAREAELRDFVDNAAEGLHWVGPDGRIQWANKSELNMLGYTEAEYIGHHIAEFHADQSVIDDILRRLNRGDILTGYEARLRCKDGSLRHVLINSSVLFRKGEFVHTRCFTRDITERKKAEEALRDNERRFREMIDSLPTPIYTTDADGRLTHFNPAAATFSGHVPQLGSDQWCVSWKLYRPDGTPLPHEECPMAIALKEGRDVRGVEAIAERPDGKRIWFTPYPTVLRDTSGRIVGGINMLVDITERRQAEATRGHLAAIVNSSDDAIISTDLNGVIQSWNEGAARTFRYRSEEAIGQHVNLIIPPDRQAEEPQILQRIAVGERIDHFETVRMGKDGRSIDVSLTVSPIRDAQHRIIGASKISRDITKQKRAHQREQQLFRVATSVNRAHALSELYEQALDAIMISLGADRASILLLDPDGIMRFKAWSGLSEGYRRAVEGHSPWTPDAQMPAPIVITNIEAAGLSSELTTVILNEGIRGLAFVPLTYGGRLIGKFMVYFPGPRTLDEEEVQLAQAIANTLALGIERRRTEDILKRSEGQLRQALQAGRMGSWEWDVTTNKVSWSPELEAIHGLAPGTFDGSFEAYQKDIHPEDRERVLKSVAQTLERGTEHHIEYRILLPDGTERWVEGKGTLYRTQEGIPTKMVGVCSEVTERKRAEEKLQASERLMRAVFNQQFAFSALLSPEGQILRFSDSVYRNNEGTGINPRDLLGQSFLDAPWWYDLPDTIADWRRQFSEALNRPGPVRGEGPYRLGNGQLRYAINTVTALRDDAGNIEYLLCEGMDITELKQSQLRLKHSAEDLERQVAIRTAELLETQDHLRALATELNLAEQRERKRLAAELHDHLQQALVLGKFKVAHAKRLLQTLPECLDVVQQFDEILTEALTYTRTLVAELSPPVLRDHGLPASLRWLAEYMKKHGMTVLVNVPENLHVALPEDQAVLLFQSARELLINAAKHSGTDHSSVTLEQREGQLSIQVRDNGQGFDVCGSAGPSDQSSKFGLFSIKERMKALGGSFTIESAPGQGTTALLTLPLAYQPENHIDSQLDPALCRTQNGKPRHLIGGSSAVIRLLLADDHAMMRQGLRMTLEHYADIVLVGEAKDGQEAIDLVEALCPHVVVMDINMPRLNGIEATAWIKAHFPDTCIIGISVNAEEDNQKAMKRAGATLLITKEAAVNDLYHAIRAGLGVSSLSGTTEDAPSSSR
jgi:PAS domain S-box-containing protein